jgi:hypothetical protein
MIINRNAVFVNLSAYTIDANDEWSLKDRKLNTGEAKTLLCQGKTLRFGETAILIQGVVLDILDNKKRLLISTLKSKAEEYKYHINEPDLVTRMAFVPNNMYNNYVCDFENFTSKIHHVIPTQARFLFEPLVLMINKLTLLPTELFKVIDFYDMKSGYQKHIVCAGRKMSLMEYWRDKVIPNTKNLSNIPKYEIIKDTQLEIPDATDEYWLITRILIDAGVNVIYIEERGPQQEVGLLDEFCDFRLAILHEGKIDRIL